MRLRNLFPLAAIFASSCILISGACIYEIRSLEATGLILENGNELAAAQVTQYEQRDSDPEKSTYWLITGATLKGHVTSVTLRDSSDPSRVLLTLDLEPSDRPPISQGAVSTKTGAALGGFFEILGTNHGFVRLDTDLPERPIIDIPLTMTRKQNWTRPNCS